jgi:tetratricopeptide (TPR) repeat protein
MRRPARKALFGTLTAATLSLAGLGLWIGAAPSPAQTAQQAPPTSPEPPRLGDGPELTRCLTLLRTDPEGALLQAERWDAAGGGEGARYCHALALLALGDTALAAERLENLATRSRAGNAARAAAYAQATQAWLLAGRANRAIATATLALTLAPDDIDLLVDRAVALGNLRRYVEAIEDLDRALALDAGRAEALVFRAAANRHLERVDQALRDVERALTLSPLNVEAFLERGIIRHLRGDAEGARQDWERTIAIAPDSAAADLATQNLALSEAGPRRR